MKATIINRDYWWNGAGGSESKATVGIDGLSEDDLIFLIGFLNTTNALQEIKKLQNKDKTLTVDSIRDVGVQDEVKKIKAKDDKKYDVQADAIGSLEL